MAATAGRLAAAPAVAPPICPTGAKYDATVHLRQAEEKGARLETEAVVHRVTTDAAGRVSAVRFLRPDRSEDEARGKVFVIAANAIETAKLLLISADERASFGLSPEPLWQHRGPQVTATVRTGREEGERTRRAAFYTMLGNSGWDWRGQGPAWMPSPTRRAGSSA
jgi:hypothetical protein